MKFECKQLNLLNNSNFILLEFNFSYLNFFDTRCFRMKVENGLFIFRKNFNLTFLLYLLT